MNKHQSMYCIKYDYMVGIDRFGLSNAGVKFQCLTTWLYPKMYIMFCALLLLISNKWWIYFTSLHQREHKTNL